MWDRGSLLIASYRGAGLVGCVVAWLGGHSAGFASACLWLDWFEPSRGNPSPFCSPGWFLKICLGMSASGFELWWANVRKDSLVSMWYIKDSCIKVMGVSWARKALYRCRSLCWGDYWINTCKVWNRAMVALAHRVHLVKVASTRSCVT